MRIHIFLCVFLLFSANLFGYQISGRVIDKNSHLPIEYASIYVNGTTIGTTSNSNGEFELRVDYANFQLAITHASYNSELLELNLKSDTLLLVRLLPKTIHIQAVQVEAQNLRNKNLEYFKELFLGRDYWGQHAIIKNDSVLSFVVDYSGDHLRNTTMIRKPEYFEVHASAPLVIEMNELGYILEYDLISFRQELNTDLDTMIVSSLGYSYYKETDPGSILHAYRIKMNRQKAYYGSPMHFIRSLYDNELMKNGYIICQIDTTTDPKYDRRYIRTIQNCLKSVYEYQINNSYQFNTPASDTLEIDATCSYAFDYGKELHRKDNEIILSALKGTRYLIGYHYMGDEPVNLNHILRYSSVHTEYSTLYILEDPCVFRKDGTLPGGQVVIGLDMSERRIGASLPANYLR